VSKLILLLLLISCDTSNEPRNFKMSDGSRGHRECEGQDNGFTIVTQKEFDSCNNHMLQPKLARGTYHKDKQTGCKFRIGLPLWGRNPKYTKRLYMGNLYCKDTNGDYQLTSQIEIREEAELK